MINLKDLGCIISWKGGMVCVRMHVCARVRMRVCVCICVCICRVSMSVCVLAQHAHTWTSKFICVIFNLCLFSAPTVKILSCPSQGYSSVPSL